MLSSNSFFKVERQCSRCKTVKCIGGGGVPGLSQVLGTTGKVTLCHVEISFNLHIGTEELILLATN